MDNRTSSGCFSGFPTLFLIIGTGFFCLCLLFWFFTQVKALVLFGLAMLFVGFANSLAFLVLNRMDEAGYKVDFWRSSKDFGLYSEYWRIAPLKGWSRSAVSGAVACFLLAVVFLFSIPIFAKNVFDK